MSLGRTLLLGDLGLQMNIEDLETDVTALRRQIIGGIRRDTSLKGTVEGLVAENAQLRLYFVSLVRLLVRKGVISKEELQAMVSAVDAEDGCVDGKYTGENRPALVRLS